MKEKPKGDNIAAECAIAQLTVPALSIERSA